MTEEQKENRRQLVAALRSGEYERNLYSLKRHNTFCVLGIACNTSNLGTWEEAENGYYSYVIKNGRNGLFAPKMVRDFYGFDDSDHENLLELNKDSFESAAKWLESTI